MGIAALLIGAVFLYLGTSLAPSDSAPSTPVTAPSFKLVNDRILPIQPREHHRKQHETDAHSRWPRWPIPPLFRVPPMTAPECARAPEHPGNALN